MDIDNISASDLEKLNSAGYTNADLELLGQTEIEALLADDDGEDGGDDRAGADHDAAARAQEQSSESAPAGDADSAGEEAGSEGDADAVDEKFVPQYHAEVPADVDDKIKGLRTEKADAFKRLMDGEIDAEEYQQIEDRVTGEIDDLRAKAMTASIFKQANEQAQEQAARNEWQRAQRAAFTEFKGEGLDYQSKPGLMAAFNTHLKTLAGDARNESRSAEWFLKEAHKLTKDELGISPARKAREGSRDIDLSAVPPTLRTVPASAAAEVNSDEFAHLRNLDGLELERAVAKMTDAQRDRWLAE